MATPRQAICQNTYLCINRSSTLRWTKCLSWCAGYSSEQWERKASPESSREENGCRKILVLCLQNTLPSGNTVTGRHKLQRTVTSEKCLDIFLFFNISSSKRHIWRNFLPLLKISLSNHRMLCRPEKSAFYHESQIIFRQNCTFSWKV